MITTIKVKMDTKLVLKELKRGGNSYDDVIQQLIEANHERAKLTTLNAALERKLEEAS